MSLNLPRIHWVGCFWGKHAASISPPWLQTQWQSCPHCSPSRPWISSPNRPADKSELRSGERMEWYSVLICDVIWIIYSAFLFLHRRRPHCVGDLQLRRWEFSGLWQYCSFHQWPIFRSESSPLGRCDTEGWSADLQHENDMTESLCICSDNGCEPGAFMLTQTATVAAETDPWCPKSPQPRQLVLYRWVYQTR